MESLNRRGVPAWKEFTTFFPVQPAFSSPGPARPRLPARPGPARLSHRFARWLARSLHYRHSLLPCRISLLLAPSRSLPVRFPPRFLAHSLARPAWPRRRRVESREQHHQFLPPLRRPDQARPDLAPPRPARGLLLHPLSRLLAGEILRLFLPLTHPAALWPAPERRDGGREGGREAGEEH